MVKIILNKKYNLEHFRISYSDYFKIFILNKI